jgi:hypothetical protein
MQIVMDAPARGHDRARLKLDLVGMASLAVLGAALVFVMVTATLSPLKDDVAWLLYVARKWLGGQRLYEDLVEVNPPLIIWIYAVPAWLATNLGAAPKLMANLLFAAFLLATSWWTATLLRGRAALFERRLPVFSVIATVLLLLPAVEFGQREHLLAAAVLPYLALFVRELEGEQEPFLAAAGAGVLAGLGCALKPSYGLALVLMEIVAAWRGRRLLRVAPVAAAFGMGVYGAAVLLLCPAFLEKAVPLALALYGATDTPYLQIVMESHRLLLAQAVTVLLCCTCGGTATGSRTNLNWANGRSAFLRHLMLALTVFAVGATIVFVMQGKNWFYHRLPATVATVLALLAWMAAMLPELATRLRTFWRNRQVQVASLMLPLAMAALLDFGLATYERMRPWVEAAVEPNLSTEVRLERLIRKEKARTYIAFSEWIALGFPVVNNTGVSWSSRFDSMWALKGELWAAKQAAHGDGAVPRAWPIRDWVAKDFVAGCPDLVVVDTRGGTNYVAVLISANPDFARAWSQYSEIASFDGLRVLKRSRAGCAANTEPRSPGPHLTSLAMEQP